MENVRSYQAAVAWRSIAIALVAAMLVLVVTRERVAAFALVAGTLIGVAYLLHIASGFNRLTKGGKGYLPFLTAESLVRVFVVGAAPFVIVGRGPAIGYFTYLAGFVAALAVAIVVYRQQISAESAETGAAS
ncbi:MAG TPA: hypothetical protein VEJ41_06055 [Candidatus Acidoferrales bacterium]|nr:hypothetical protein [Candidatus Acidoferrales bacterium]